MQDQYTKLIVFIHTSNEQSQNNINKTIPFLIEAKRIKRVGVNLTKKVQDLYTENYKTLLKEIEDDTNR